jgi:hypothetical protein
MPPLTPPPLPILCQSRRHCRITVASTPAAMLQVPLFFIVVYYFSVVEMEVVIVRRGATGDDVSASFRGEKRGASDDAPPATTSLIYKHGRGGGHNARNASLVCLGCVASNHAPATLHAEASCLPQLVVVLPLVPSPLSHLMC